ncbi:MAG: OmpA family protein [Spirochaetales bacterium]
MVRIAVRHRRLLLVLGFACVVPRLFAQPTELHALGGYILPIAARAEAYEPGFAGEIAATFPSLMPQRLALRGELGVMQIPGTSGATLLSGNIGLGIEYTIVKVDAFRLAAEASGAVHFGSVSSDPTVTGFGYGFDAGLVGRWQVAERWALELGAEYNGYPQLLNDIQLYAGTEFALPRRQEPAQLQPVVAPQTSAEPTRDDGLLVSVELEGVPFTPDGDGSSDELRFLVTTSDGSTVETWTLSVTDRNERLFFEREGSGAPGTIIWDGAGDSGETVLSADRYRYELTVRNAEGETAQAVGAIPVGILVREEADASRISISSIAFRGNTPELELDPDTELGRNNREVLAQLAETLARFEAYSVRIVGHAVNLTGTQREEREILAPLSLARAQNVRSALIDRGVDGRRIVAEGRGGLEPLLPHDDLDRRWRNRRVELILIRE